MVGDQMRYAIIENGVVINVAEADAEFAVQQGWVECPTAGPGWTYANGVFTAPPPAPIPEPPPAPTKEQLMAELAALTAKIQALE
jgi:hypothetical protein